MQAICRKCKQELEVSGQEVKDCPDCEEAGFITGTKGLSIIADKITCTCDEPNLSMKMHINMKPRHYYEYNCVCGNVIIMN